jgi:[ribosomal protein S5]-alanine N-acetyltransferase
MRLETPRLLLVPNTLQIIQKRLETAEFDLELPSVGIVHFPSAFPMDTLQFYPGMRDHLEAGDALSPGGIVIERTSRTTVGEIGCKGEPRDGVADIGYGFIPEVWNRGYATEITRAFSDWLLERSDVNRVTADTAVTNPASARVLEKSGFVSIGTGFNADDGDLILWEKRAPRS